MLSVLLHADDLVLMSETIEGLRNTFFEWKEAFESMGLEVNLWRAYLMTSSGITKVGLSKSKVDTCAVCSLRVNANSILCVQCGKWIHGLCIRVKLVTAIL